MNSKSNYNGLKGLFKFISTIISWTALVILILLALFLAYYTIGSKLSPKGEKFEPVVSLYTIITPSMTPNINVYDVIVAKKVKKPEDIKVGDVITFVSTSSISRGMIITHRVVEVSTDESGVVYKTKGDNNLSPDSAPAKYDNVIGKVILRIPQLGRLQEFIASKGGWLIVIVLPALFIIISDILKIFKLSNVKNRIEEIDKKEKLSKKEKIQREEKRKENLKRRLNVSKNENEPEPIKTKKNVRIVVAEKSKPKKEDAKKTTKSSKNKRVRKTTKIN